MKRACVGFLLFTPLFSLAANRLEIAVNGNSSYKIVLSRDASPSEKRGAAELQKFLAEMSGAHLPVVTDEAKLSGRLIAVGASSVTRALGIQPPPGEAYLLKTSGRALVIAGGRQRGTMYGVYAFLDKLGCRWFTRDVSRIPKMASISIGPLDETGKPGFEYREPFFTEAFDKDWAARNKVNGEHQELDESTGGKVTYYPFVHSFAALVPVSKYFKDHPEYFSLIGGKRRAERTQLCVTNPDVLRVAVAQVREWIRQHPEAKIISVSQNDWTGWCECDNCRRVEQEEGGVHSGPLLRFVNALAAQIEQTNPDKLIDALAYWYTEPPPSHVRPRRNVRVRLCPIGACQAHPFEKCERSAYFMKDLDGWSKITNQLYIWHYNTNFAHYLLPFPDYDELAADIPMYQKHGVVGIFLEGDSAPGGGGEDAELRSYVMARLLWNPQTDVNRDIDEFLDAVYGPAAKTMRAYFELRHREARKGAHMWIFDNPGAAFIGPDFVVEARALFAQALREAGDASIRRRLEKDRLSVEYVDLIRSKGFSIRDGIYAPDHLDVLKERSESFLNEARKFGITNLREGSSLENEEKDFQSHIKPYRVVALENERLHVEVAPELNARVVRMIDRRTGRDVLRQPDPGERAYPDQGGLVSMALPGFYSAPGASCAESWRVQTATAVKVVLDGDCPNGLQLQEVLRLEGARLEIAFEATNGSAAAVHTTLVTRAEFGPGTEDPDLAVAYTRQDGAKVDRNLYHAGVETSGAEAMMGGERPDGEWRTFQRGHGPGLVNRFPKSEVARTTLNWSVRSEQRTIPGIWSPEKDLAPGEKLELDCAYSIE